MWKLDQEKAKGWRIDAFEVWCWRRLLRVPWTARRSKQSILKEINSEHSLKGLMLQLKLQYFAYLMQRTDSLEKTLMLGKIEGRRKRDERVWDGWMASLTRWTWVWASSKGVGDGQGSLACCSPWGRKESDTTEQLNWTEGGTVDPNFFRFRFLLPNILTLLTTQSPSHATSAPSHISFITAS